MPRGAGWITAEAAAQYSGGGMPSAPPPKGARLRVRRGRLEPGPRTSLAKTRLCPSSGGTSPRRAVPLGLSRAFDCRHLHKITRIERRQHRVAECRVRLLIEESALGAAATTGPEVRSSSRLSKLASPEGVEPSSSVLETEAHPIYHGDRRWHRLPVSNWRLPVHSGAFCR